MSDLIHSYLMGEETKDTATIERMFAAGAHFGYSKSRRHPSVDSFIFGAKNRVEIFDLEKTSELLKEAKAFAEGLGREEKILLLVGGKSEAVQAVRKGAGGIRMPYVAGRWLGGTLTNFSEIRKRIQRLLDLRAQRESGELAEKYTKKEQLLMGREIAKLEENFDGLIPLGDKLPHALFVVDTRKERTAVREARDKGIPIIGLLNSDCNAGEIDYPIPANDASMKSIEFFVNEIVSAYKEGMKNKTVIPEKSEEPQERGS
jgi:small subunit ribosomal protein S2